MQFDYQVCLVQKRFVTFVNEEWQGTSPLDQQQPGESLESCPKVWKYLQTAGAEGWELVGVASQSHEQTEWEGVMLFLKRQK